MNDPIEYDVFRLKHPEGFLLPRFYVFRGWALRRDIFVEGTGFARKSYWLAWEMYCKGRWVEPETGLPDGGDHYVRFNNGAFESRWPTLESLQAALDGIERKRGLRWTIQDNGSRGELLVLRVWQCWTNYCWALSLSSYTGITLTPAGGYAGSTSWPEDWQDQYRENWTALSK